MDKIYNVKQHIDRCWDKREALRQRRLKEQRDKWLIPLKNILIFLIYYIFSFIIAFFFWWWPYFI
jgi:uncharacterized membrane protein (DUF485 family)